MNPNLDFTRSFCEFVRKAVSNENYSKDNHAKMLRMADNIDLLFAQIRGFGKMIPVVKKAFLEKNSLKIIKVIEKIEARNRAFTNDFPFKEKDEVAVIRFEHGWMDGRMTAKIISCHQSTTGKWSYTAQVQNEDGTYDPDHIIEIRNTRDARLVN